MGKILRVSQNKSLLASLFWGGDSIIIAIIILFVLVVYLSTVMVRRKKNTNFSFLYGFGVSILAYTLSSFLFFWFAVFRRMAVLNIPFKFDSEIAFAAIIVPIITAVPWLPSGIVTGLISLKKGNKTSLKFLYVFLVTISMGLAILFWNLPYS